MDNGDGASAASSPMSARSVGRARAGSASNKPPSTTMIGMKIQNQARELEEKRKQERKKGLMVLVLRYLSDNGYFNSADVLEEESGVSLQKYDAADNMDLLTILTEYEEYYELKFDKKPKFMRKIADDANHARSKTTGAVGGLKRRTSASSSNVNLPKINKARGASTPTPPSNYGNVDSYSSNISIISNNLSNGSGAVVSNNNSAAEKRKSSGGNDKKSSENNNVDDTSDNGSENNDGFGFDISGTKITTKKPPLASKDNKEAGLKQKPSGGPAARGTNNNNNNNVKKRISSADSRLQGNDNSGDEDDYYENRMLKPMPDFGFNNELRELAAIIQRDIIMETPNVHWNDISGLEKAKQLLKEAVVAPVKYPQFFTGLLKPWKGVLLFGPPGTGKTMLAKAVATECRTTFFNISASSIVSKWRGDSEKLVRILFELARHHRPSTIFLDELDAIMGQRDSSGTEHEGSRRLKTELLIQMDGLAKSTDLVFVLAASNLPWELDTAMLRRLEKRILVPLPGVEARQMMFQQYLVDSGAEEGRVAADIDCADLARRTEGYSGSDIVLVCKEAAMRPLRRMMKQLEDLNLNLDSLDDKNGGDADSELANATVKIEPVTKEDVDAALAATRPTAQKYLSKYSEWEKECGSSV